MKNKLSDLLGGVPVLGSACRLAYLHLIRGEGRVHKIERGHLSGMKYRRYLWSTGDAEMVETNWETALPEAFLRELEGRSIFYDVGANWGFYSLLAAKRMGPGGRIVAFEAHPRTARQLASQLRLNRVTRATVVPMAVSAAVGRVLFTDGDGSQVQRICVPAGSRDAVVEVESITLDEASRRYGVPDLIKIDVEGAEADVLRGALGLLRTHRPALIVETHSPEACGQVYDLLEPLGYRFRDPDGRPLDSGHHAKHIISY